MMGHVRERLLAMLVLAVALIGVMVALWVGIDRAHALQPTPQPLNVVVLGDSYSASTGAGDYYGPDGCYRSSTSWAERYVDQLISAGFAPTLSNRACNGSHIDHLTSEHVLSNSTDRLESVDGNHESASDSQWEQLLGPSYCPPSVSQDDKWTFSASDALYNPSLNRTAVRAKCTHAVAPQIAGIGDETDLVLVTMGGNDGGFGSIVQNCFAGLAEHLVPDDCAGSIAAADDFLDDPDPEGFRAELETALLAIEQELPDHARVVLVSYPYLSLPGITNMNRALPMLFRVPQESGTRTS